MGIHKTSPTKSASSDLSLSRQSRVYTISRRTILAVIILAMLSVAFATLFAIIVTPERVVTSNIESIVRDYYENYYYDTVGLYDNVATTRAEILSEYERTGLATLSLRQLLYFDNNRHLDQRSSLEAYCDLDGTTFRIYPEPPFGRTDYRVDYRYSCEF